MNILFSTVGRRGYIVDFFKQSLPKGSKLVGTSDRNDHTREFTSGFFHCDKSYLVPSINEERTYIDALLKICKDEEIQMLLSFYDLDTYILSKYKKEFEALGVVPIISSFDVNSICFDKIETFKFLRNNGFKTPWTISSEEAREKGVASYPVIVKPRFGFGSNAISIASNKEEMAFFLKYYDNEDMMVQEMLEGPEYSFDILNDLHGKPITAIVKRKIKMRAGETDQGYAIKNEAFVKTAMELGQKLKHIGPLDVDFFIRNDEAYILELNPRFGGGYPMTHLAGIDFPKLIIDMVNDDITEETYTNNREYTEGIVMIKNMNFLTEKC